MKAILVREPGGPEALELIEVPQPEPRPGEALVRVAAAGVNFIDVYFRTGFYPAPERPIQLGMEGAGVVEKVGEGVTHLQAGDRVAWAMQRGSYAEYQTVPAWKLVPLPEAVELQAGAQIMLQGMTAHYLTHDTWNVQPGQTVLVHACAGGAGLLTVQLAKLKGATVIGTCSADPVKIRHAADTGCDHIIRYTNFVKKVKDLTGGRGVDVIYDSVGKTTFKKGLDLLRPRGMMVAFGQSSGPAPKIDPLDLNKKGSIFLTRPSLGHYAATPEEVHRRAGDLFQWIADGKLKLFLERTYPLWDAAEAHRALESRKTSGKLILTVG
ncbi:MAG: quinone oxidoreductase [Bryobacter sp.]|nr:quinone oxidoreductase [Bryobacter sp.]